MATPPTPSTPFTSAPSTSTEGVTLDAIMAQFQLIDARLDTLSIELYQARFGGFVESPSPPPKAPEASEDDDDSDDNNDGEDGDAFVCEIGN